MNTVGDVFKLTLQGGRSLMGMGMTQTENQEHFDKRINELVISTFVSFCFPPKEQKKYNRASLPSLEVMRSRLEGLNPNMVLRKQAQARYYCAVAFLLTVDGHTKDDLLTQQLRALHLIDYGLLSSLEHVV